MILPNKNTREKGQALLLVLVGMGTVLVMALSVISRSITDISLTGKEDESSRAFSAAEAGIEQLLINPSFTIGESFSGDVDGNTYVSSASLVADGAQNYKFIKDLDSGEMGTVWFVSHDVDNNFVCDVDHRCVSDTGLSMDFYWGDVESPDETAIEVVVYYDTSSGQDALGASPDFSGVAVKRYAYDPKAGRTPDNNFSNSVNSATGLTIDGVTYKYHLETYVNLSTSNISCAATDGCLLFARVRLLYNTTPQPVLAKLIGSSVFPAQGKKVSSTGSAGGSTRKVELIQAFREPLTVFESGVYSNNGLIKNN